MMVLQTHAVQKEWKVVELDNDFIKVIILPQIGGKIWTAIDKKNDKPFIYDNDAIKFRDIAMRGPWTSGGLEANFGIYWPHSRCSYTGKLSYAKKCRWKCELHHQPARSAYANTVEYGNKFPKDKAYFITRFFWHNATPLAQPYYSWMNLGAKSL